MLNLNNKLMDKHLLDFIYPVGSYYETSDTSFNPNNTWGGTWLEDTKGRVTVALDSNDTDFDTIGATGGSKFLQEHSHTFTGQQKLSALNSGGTGTYIGAGTTTTNKTGTGDSGNLQPYIVVKRWHRTA